MHNRKLLIDGRLVDGDDTLSVINPATGRIFTEVARASPQQFDEAVGAAKKAFRAWSVTNLGQRQALLVALADSMRANASELAKALTLEQGKPLAEASMEIGWAEGFLRHYATLGPSHRVIQDDADFRIEMRRVPIGVVVRRQRQWHRFEVVN